MIGVYKNVIVHRNFYLTKTIIRRHLFCDTAVIVTISFDKLIHGTYYIYHYARTASYWARLPVSTACACKKNKKMSHRGFKQGKPQY